MKLVKLTCLVCSMLLSMTGFAQGVINWSTPLNPKPTRERKPIEAGETWSYTKHTSDGSVSTFFVFTSNTDVVWLFGTPFGNYFPVGFGKYNSSTNNVTFSASHKLHTPIALYYSGEDIIFNIDRIKKIGIHKAGKKWLDRFYNEGDWFTITKENFKLAPSRKLVGSTWKTIDEEKEKDEVYFKTWNEVMLKFGEEERTMAYVCIGDMIAIKSGDTIDDENLIGIIQNGNEVTLCREGLNPKKHGGYCVTLYKE